MATPAYVPYDVAKPNIAQVRQAVIDGERTNLLALHDAFCALLFTMPAWNIGLYLPGGWQGTPLGVYPYYGGNLFWTIYNTNANGVTGWQLQFSNDGLSTAVLMGDLTGKANTTVSSDANGYVNSITWS
jgi:hypothetical protein